MTTTTVTQQQISGISAGVAVVFTFGSIPVLIWLMGKIQIHPHILHIPESGMPALQVSAMCLGLGGAFAAIATGVGRRSARAVGIACCVVLVVAVALVLIHVVTTASS